jgi:16S rRNA (uracil1498-N3)-methyltransferase
MNLILLTPEDLIDENTARVRDQRRLNHLHTIHRVGLGEHFKVGLINGKIGQGNVIHCSDEEIRLTISLTQLPPAALPITLILALPRPKMLKRSLQTLATLGIKKIYLINSFRVEKSYWQTPWLQATAIRDQLVLGLEQGADTLLPEVTLIKRFKPFVEDNLPQIITHTRALVAHPYSLSPCPTQINEPISLAIGPEGGFIPFEIDLLEAQGFSAVNLGERIMRVETVLPYLIGRLFS